jgi:hypothetical protein
MAMVAAKEKGNTQLFYLGGLEPKSLGYARKISHPMLDG